MKHFKIIDHQQPATCPWFFSICPGRNLIGRRGDNLLGFSLRECKRKCAALTQFAIHPNMPAVHGQKLVHKIETDSHATSRP